MASCSAEGRPMTKGLFCAGLMPSRWCKNTKSIFPSISKWQKIERKNLVGQFAVLLRSNGGKWIRRVGRVVDEGKRRVSEGCRFLLHQRLLLVGNYEALSNVRIARNLLLPSRSHRNCTGSALWSLRRSGSWAVGWFVLGHVAADRCKREYSHPWWIELSPYERSIWTGFFF